MHSVDEPDLKSIGYIHIYVFYGTITFTYFTDAHAHPEPRTHQERYKTSNYTVHAI
jgi:hypothetical protein